MQNKILVRETVSFEMGVAVAANLISNQLISEISGSFHRLSQ
jgi:hypothetical protein